MDRAWLTPQVLRWSVGLLFLGMAVWTMIPDKIEEEEAQVATRLGVFGATLVTFFLAEMGDKTQIATLAMAAHYPSALLVVAGTTLGMLIADVPAVFIGDRLAGRIPMKLVHTIAALLFAVLGVATLRAWESSSGSEGTPRGSAPSTPWAQAGAAPAANRSATGSRASADSINASLWRPVMNRYSCPAWASAARFSEIRSTGGDGARMGTQAGAAVGSSAAASPGESGNSDAK